MRIQCANGRQELIFSNLANANPPELDEHDVEDVMVVSCIIGLKAYSDPGSNKGLAG
jgi:hypothetical protein